MEDILKNDLSLISAKREQIHAQTKDVMKELEDFSTKHLTKTQHKLDSKFASDYQMFK